MKPRKKTIATGKGSEIDAHHTMPSTSNCADADSDSDCSSPTTKPSQPRRSLRQNRYPSRETTRSSVTARSSVCRVDGNHNEISSPSSSEAESSESEAYAPPRSRNRNRQSLSRALTCPPKRAKTRLNQTIGEVIRHSDSDSDDCSFKCPRCQSVVMDVTIFKCHVADCFQSKTPLSEPPAKRKRKTSTPKRKLTPSEVLQNGSNVYSCPRCPYRNTNSNSVICHIRKCTGRFKDKFTVDFDGTPHCLACNYTTKHMGGMNRHLKLVHCTAKSDAPKAIQKRVQPLGDSVEHGLEHVANVKAMLPEVSVSPEARGSKVVEVPPPSGKSNRRLKRAPVTEVDATAELQTTLANESLAVNGDSNPVIESESDVEIPTPKSKKRRRKKQISLTDDKVMPADPHPRQSLPTTSNPPSSPFFQLLPVSSPPTVTQKKKEKVTRAGKNSDVPKRSGKIIRKCPDCNYESSADLLKRHMRLKHAKALDWLSVADKEGNVIPESTAASKAIDKTTAVTATCVVDGKNDKFFCKYCNTVVVQTGRLMHLSLFHLDVRGSCFPTIYSMQPNTAHIAPARPPPETDDWPIDFSRTVQDDPCIQVARKTYNTMFHVAAPETYASQNFDVEYDRFFAYTYKHLTGHDTYYFYECPSCSEKIKTLTLPMLQIAVIAHIGLHHRMSRCLTFLVEQELSLFNSTFNTTYEIRLSLGPGPLLASDFLLRDDEFFVAQCYGPERVEADSKFFICRQCFLVFLRFSDFTPHLSKVHGITKRHRLTLVKPQQLQDRRMGIQRLNDMDQFALAIDKGNWIWACTTCTYSITAPTAMKFFTLMGAHLISKVSSIEMYSRRNSFFTALLGGQAMSVAEMANVDKYYAYLITNCRDLATKQRTLSSSSTTYRSTHLCYFCGFRIEYPSDVSQNIAIVGHIIQDHDDIVSNASMLSFMASSGAEGVFPFLDPVFEGHLAPAKRDRRLRCAICQCIFKTFRELRTHAMLHLDASFDLDPAKYTFVMTTNRCKQLVYNINGIGKRFEPIEFPSEDEKLYACLQCATIFEESPNLKFRLYEHIRYCPFPLVDTVPVFRKPCPELRETNYQKFSMYECPGCSKQYSRDYAATCCTNGNISSATMKENESTSLKEVPYTNLLKRVQIVD